MYQCVWTHSCIGRTHASREYDSYEYMHMCVFVCMGTRPHWKDMHLLQVMQVNLLQVMQVMQVNILQVMEVNLLQVIHVWVHVYVCNLCISVYGHTAVLQGRRRLPSNVHMSTGIGMYVCI